MWDRRGASATRVFDVALNSAHRMSVAKTSCNKNIISTSGSHDTVMYYMQKYSYNSRSCNRNSDSGNMKTGTIKACMQVNPCNNNIRI